MARLKAIAELQRWLESGAFQGGHEKAQSRRKRADRPMRLLLSDRVEFTGSDDNITLRAKGPLPPGELILGVTAEAVLHPRSPMVSEEREQQVQEAVARLRQVAEWSTPLVDSSSEGRLELICLLAFELIAGEEVGKTLNLSALYSSPSIERYAKTAECPLWLLVGL